MIKDNFICPCCGLPNHLEFQSMEDYNKIKSDEATGTTDNITPIFENFLIGEGEGRTSVESIKVELKERLEKVQQISNRFNEQSFQDWFDENVVCFIREGDSND